MVHVQGKHIELQAILLGLLQGVGEFLPISSSAHLALAPYVMGTAYQGLAYDVMLHLGTLLAIIIYFARDWAGIIKAGLTRPKEADGRLLWLLIAGTVPAAVIGLLLENLAETAFRNPIWIAVNLVVFSGLIYAADRKPAQNLDSGGLTLRHILLIGLAQCIALMPGASRSGMTIMAALFLGYTRYDAARLSFLLATPVIFGAGLLELRHLGAFDLNAAFAAGLAASFFAGLASIKFLLTYLKSRNLTPFLIYRVLLGLFIFWLAFSRS